MSEQDELFEPDLIDRIANALPLGARAEYYRELRHCRSLPENDEMLRILRAMQFSVLLMVEVPQRIATERTQFECTVTGAMKVLQEIRQFSAEHQAQIDQRLAQLSADIAEGLKPEAVAATINESLRQQFVKSTIPETADALAVSAARIKKATGEFLWVAGTLGDAYQGAAKEARTAIDGLESTCSQALSATKRGVEELLYFFRKEYRWCLFAFVFLALLLGFGLCAVYEHR
jgi:hypothetical protein